MIHVYVCDNYLVTSPSRVRREPTQRRSRERFDRILEAALSSALEIGDEATTIRAIADRAQVPVATIYQFFSDRDAVLAEAVASMLERIDEQMGKEFTGRRYESVAAFVDAFAEAHERLYMFNADLVRLYFSARRTDALQDDVRKHLDRLADVFFAMLVEGGVMPPDTDRRVIALAVELGDRLFEVAYRGEPGGDSWVIDQSRRAMTTYLEASCRT